MAWVWDPLPALNIINTPLLDAKEAVTENRKTEQVSEWGIEL